VKLFYVYNWRRFVPALIRGHGKGFYRRWPIRVKVSVDRLRFRGGIPLGLHGIQCGWRAVQAPGGATTERVYTTALALGPLIVLFGPERARLDGHPEDIAEWVWIRHQGDIYRLAGTEADRRLEKVRRDARRSLRRALEESTS
jgi:hypothetical protein